MSQFQKSRFLITACLLVFADSGYGESLRSDRVAAPAAPSMTVRVYNYAGVSQRELSLVESMATELFRESGVQIVWYDCGGSSLADDDPGCGKRASLVAFDLRVCRTCTSQAASEYGVRGFAVGSMATVSTAWCEEISRSLYVPSEEILGRVIVHELGHLLLGPGHSPVGIMKAHWTREDLRRKNLGMLTFTADQAQLLRFQVKSRRAADERAALATSETKTELLATSGAPR
jgi:hypothetical protein